MRHTSDRSALLLILLFAVVHAYLCGLALIGVDLFSGDVLLYRHWAEQWLSGGPRVAVDTPWVYPAGALAPVLLVGASGPFYLPAWLGLVIVLDGVAVLVVARRSRGAAMWWLVALAALGPISLTRLDAIASAAAVIGVSVLERHPRVTGVLLAIGAWVKVAPAALIAAQLTSGRRRLPVAVGAAAASAVIIAVDFGLGGGAFLLSFAGQQVDRGLQVEAPVALPWLWLGAAGRLPGRPFYDERLLTWEITGPGTQAAAAVSTIALMAVASLILVLGLLARRSNDAVLAVPLVAIGLTADFLVLNKVGSPQYLTWFAAPVILALLVRPGAFRVPAVLVLLACLLTDVVDTRAYPQLLALDTLPLGIMTARDLVLAALLVWSVARLGRLVGSGRRMTPLAAAPSRLLVASRGSR